MVSILTQVPVTFNVIGSCTTDPIEGHDVPKHTDVIFAVIESKRTNRQEKFAALINCGNAGFDVNTQNKSGETPLISCVRKRFLEGGRFLLEAGCDVNIRDNTGSTALHYCFLGSVEANIVLLKMLLELGANPNMKDFSGTTSMHLALVCGNKDIFQTMVSHNGDLSELKAQDCVDLIMRFGFRLNFDIEVMMQRLYCLGCPLFKCCRIIQLLKMWDIDCISASAFLDTITDAVPRLTELSRLKVRKCLQKSDSCGQISDLDLPSVLRKFLQMERLDIKAIEVVKTAGGQDPLSEIMAPNR